MTDLGEIGHLAAEVMDRAEEMGGEIGTVAIVAELNFGPDAEHEHGYTEIIYRSTECRKWVQWGFFRQAARAVMYGEAPPDD